MTEQIDAVREIMAQARDVDLPEDMASPGFDDPGFDGIDLPPAPPPMDDGAPPPPEAICAAFPLNDYGNARRFVTHFGQDVLWVPRVGFFVWAGTHWRRDQDEIALRRHAHQLSALIAKETWHMRLSPRDQAAIEDGEAAADEVALLEQVSFADRTPEQRVSLKSANMRIARAAEVRKEQKGAIGRRLTHAKNAGNTNAIKNLLAEAAVMIARPLEDLDAGALDVNCQNGVLRFSAERHPNFAGDGVVTRADVELVAHAREQLLSKVAPVEYDPDATCPLFDTFLERVQPVPAMRRFIQRWLGLSMTALTGEQKFAFFYGNGANGKSVLVDLMSRLLGDYAASAKIESLTGRNRRGGGDATPDLVPMIGARFVRASEPDEGERLQEGLIKELTGGEPILIRALHSDFVLIYPYFKLTISGNVKPEIRGGDDGIWRRVMLVPWDVQIPVAERDPNLVEKLLAEAPGILNWLRDGLLEYLEAGLQVPAEVFAATQEYREDSDPVGTFLNECCHVSGDARDSVTARELGEAFNFWLDDAGRGTWTPMTVSKRLAGKAGKWRSAVTGQVFVARKSSQAFYDGVTFAEPFGTRWRGLPRDAQGRVLRGAKVADE